MVGWYFEEGVKNFAEVDMKSLVQQKLGFPSDFVILAPKASTSMITKSRNVCAE